jgi:hypothetical protein
VIFALSITYLIRYIDIPFSRRLSVGLGAAGMLLAPTIAWYLYEIFASIIGFFLIMFIILGGIKLILRSLFG